MKDIDALQQPTQAYRIYSSRMNFTEASGGEWEGLCPFHEEKTPSFRLYVHNGVLLFKCFGCQKAGNVLQFVQWLDSCTFKQAVEKAQTIVGTWTKGKHEVEQTFKPLGKKESKTTYPLTDIQAAEAALATNPVAAEWLAGRGITLATARKFHLGYIQSVRAISADHPWVNDGWIIFPTIEDDKITLLKYRSVRGKKHESGIPGFLRRANMATGLFNAQVIEPFDDLFVVEGEPDCLVMNQAGYIAVSLPGAGFSPTADMKDSIMQAHRIYLAGDMDHVGQQAMHKLWTELRERTYLIRWPEGCKDANDCFLKTCGGNEEKFRAKIEELKKKSHEQPMPHVHDLKETLRHADDLPPMENPDRLRFPWPLIDHWTPILPGDVMTIFASESGMGKTSFLMDVLLHNTIEFGKTVVNYSAEVLPQQYARRAAAYLTNVDKNLLTKEQFVEASEKLKEARFYNGYKPGADWRQVVELLEWAIRRIGADIVTVDHLMFLTRSERDEAKAQSEAMRALKDLAFEYNKIVIVVGQPRKAHPNQRGREVTMQDAKGSEAFGSDASQVFILHRKRLPNDGTDDAPVFSNETKVVLDKSRESGTRATRLWFRGEVCGFFSMETQRYAA